MGFEICCFCYLVTKSCPTLGDPKDCSPARILCSWDFSGKNTDVGCHFLLHHLIFFCCSVAQSCPTLCNPWTAACQASLSFTISPSLVKLVSTELVMPTNHLILCRPLLLQPSIFPASGSFQISQFFASGGLSIAVLASASVLPMNTQD